MQTAPDVAKDPDFQTLTAEVTSIVAVAAEYRIATVEERAAAAQELVRINTAAARLETMRLTITRPLDAAKEAVMALFRPKATELEAASINVRAAMRRYDNEQEQLRLQQQREAEEAARKERERLQREANERQAEAERKATEERQAAEAARAAGNLAEADKHDRKADQVVQRAEQRAEVLQERAATFVAPVFQANVPKVAGVAGRIVWKYRVKDESLVPREYLMLDEKKIAGVVRAMKADTKIAGIEAYSERDYSGSRRGVG